MKTITNFARHCLLVLILSLATGCALIPLHKPDIKQGNIITAEMIQELKTGMTKQQILSLLGTPVLENNFVTERWYYVYTFQPGKGNGDIQRKYLVVHFKNNLVINIVNSYPIEPFHGK